MKILQALPVVLALAACNKSPLESGVSGREQEVAGAQAGSIYFNIRNGSDAPATRAGDGELFHPNEERDEYLIGTKGNYALLFDDKGAFFSFSALNLATDSKMEGHQEEHEVDVIYKTRFNTLPENDRQFQCLVILNCPSDFEAELTNENMQKEDFALGKVLERIWKDRDDPRRIGLRTDEEDKVYFTMTNSIYFDGNGKYTTVPIGPNNIIDENEIPEDKLADEISKRTVIVHVERMLAKFSLELNGAGEDFVYAPEVHPSANENPNDFLSQNHRINLVTGWTTADSYEDADGVQRPFISNDHAPVVEPREWRAQVVGWGMNALETESHLFKQIEGAPAFTGWSWNDSDNYRSYWTEDPHYGDDCYYPWQYRPAVNRVLNWYGNLASFDYATPQGWTGPHGENVHETGTPWSNLLLNYAWNDEHLDYLPGDIIYAPENTYDPNYSRNLDERRELLAGTHLIVRAKLLVNDGNGAYEPLPYLYRDRAGTCYRTAQDCVWGLVRAFNYALASQTRMRYRYYDWNTSTNTPTTLYAVPTVTYDDGATDDTAFKLYYRGEELNYEYIMGTLTEDACRELLAEARIKDGDGKRLLNTSDFSIKKRIDPGDPSKDIELPIYEIYEVGVDEVTEDGETTFKPREQVRREEEIYANANDIQSLIFEWVGPVDYFVDGMMYYAAPAQIVSEQIYGAVRNAWYRFTVTGINNIGIPVHDGAMPIVPNWENPYDMINVKVNVLDWHKVTGDAGVLPNDPPKIVKAP